MNPQIYSIFPSDKVGIILEDVTANGLKNPKIRIAMIPTAKGTGNPVNFYIDLPVARVLFEDLGKYGCLQDDLLFKTMQAKNGDLQVFDLFATIPGKDGHRALTISNMDDGIFLKIINKSDGDSISQAASLQSHQARIMGRQLACYIGQLDLLSIAKSKTEQNTQRQDEQDARDGFVDDFPTEFEDSFPG
jgi:hypothetical protein